MTTFTDLGIASDIVDALAGKGIIDAFPIQEQTIPLALSGQDIIGQAKTGTGKTFGFGLPIIQRLGDDPEGGVKALVVVPTRELCVQVTEDLELATSNRPTKIVSIYGGKAYEGQIEQLKAGAQIVVGTPGRLLDLASQRLLSLKNVQRDGARRGRQDARPRLPPRHREARSRRRRPTRHTMLFSATMPGPIVALARRFMTRPIHIRATDPDEGLTQANIKHLVYRAHSLDKDEVIARILQSEGRGKTIIFTRTKRAAAKLVEELNDRGFNAAAVHGDLNQDQRERAMAAFKAGKKDVLIATDVAARGIDVDDVTHVINHTIPDDDKAYLHRVGPHGPRRQDRHRGHVRRLGRPAQVGAHQPRPRVRPARADRDLLVEPAPVHRPRHPRRHEGPAQAGPAAAAPTRSAPRPQRGRAPRATGRPRAAHRSRVAARAAASRAGDASATRRRRGRAEPTAADGARKEPGTGTHDGKGHEHHDGNAAPAPSSPSPRPAHRPAAPRPQA